MLTKNMLFKVFTLCLLGINSADVSSQKTNSVILVPEYRAIEELPDNSYEYQIVPTSDYEITEYKTTETILSDLILNPFRALANVGSTAASAIGWVLTKLSLVFFGMSIVIGFCAFTSYCTLTVENPFSSDLNRVYLILMTLSTILMKLITNTMTSRSVSV